MPSFRGPTLRESDMWGMTPLDQMLCRILFKRSRYEGTLTPPYRSSDRRFLIPAIPAASTGAAFRSMSIAALMIVNWMRLPSRVELLTREEARDRGFRASTAREGRAPAAIRRRTLRTRLKWHLSCHPRASPAAHRHGGPCRPWTWRAAESSGVSRWATDATAGHGALRSPSAGDDGSPQQRRFVDHSRRTGLHRCQRRQHGPRIRQRLWKVAVAGKPSRRRHGHPDDISVVRWAAVRRHRSRRAAGTQDSSQYQDSCICLATIAREASTSVSGYHGI